jgi:hypothetical protein
MPETDDYLHNPKRPSLPLIPAPEMSPEYELEQYLFEVVTKDYSEEYVNREAVARTTAKLIPNIMQEVKQGDLKQRSHLTAYGLCAQALRRNVDLFTVLHPAYSNPANEEKPNYLWRHYLLERAFNPTRDDVCMRGIDKSALQEEAAAYLSSPAVLHHDYIEWCIVDALVYFECSAYSFRLEQLRLEGKVYRYMVAFGGLILFAIFGALASLAWWFAGLAWWPLRLQQGGADRAGWVIGALVAYLLYCAIQWLRGGKLRSTIKSDRLRPFQLLKSMMRAYQTLDGAVLNPSRVRDELLSAEKEGVVWPTAIWPILDTAIARNPGVWQVAERQY